METTNINLAEDGSSISILVGASGNIILENDYDGKIQWSATDNTGAWHTLLARDTIKVDFDIYARKTDKFSRGKLIVTK